MEENPLPTPTTPEEPRRSRVGRWLPGIVLILIGLIFLANNIAGLGLYNWWAVFILIPAVSSFVTAWERYRQAGSLDRHARNALFGGVLLTLVAAILLFNLSWSIFGPLLLILLGGLLLLSYLAP